MGACLCVIWRYGVGLLNLCNKMSLSLVSGGATLIYGGAKWTKIESVNCIALCQCLCMCVCSVALVVTVAATNTFPPLVQCPCPESCVITCDRFTAYANPYSWNRQREWEREKEREREQQFMTLPAWTTLWAQLIWQSFCALRCED